MSKRIGFLSFGHYQAVPGSLVRTARDDARFALDLGVDYLALSFVGRAQDVEDLRSLIREADRPTSLHDHGLIKLDAAEAL